MSQTAEEKREKRRVYFREYIKREGPRAKRLAYAKARYRRLHPGPGKPERTRAGLSLETKCSVHGNVEGGLHGRPWVKHSAFLAGTILEIIHRFNKQ